MIVDNTLLDMQNSSYSTQPHSIIANCIEPGKRSGVIRVNIVIKLSIHSLLYRPRGTLHNVYLQYSPAETLSRYGNMFCQETMLIFSWFCTRREDSQRRELLCTILPYAQAYESKRHGKCPKILK